MQTLSAEEMASLVGMVSDEFGPGLNFDDFSDAVLGMFEDIPGLETIAPAMATRYIKQLWSEYHG